MIRFWVVIFNLWIWVKEVKIEEIILVKIWFDVVRIIGDEINCKFCSSLDL